MITDEYDRVGDWISTACINWHHPDCRTARCICTCHSQMGK